MPLRRDTLYRVQMTVKGGDFSTAVNGQMVDSWSDEKLRSGGVGFFADNGEVASLRYVQITDKDTVLGRFLSYLGFLRPHSLAGPVEPTYSFVTKNDTMWYPSRNLYGASPNV